MWSDEIEQAQALLHFDETSPQVIQFKQNPLDFPAIIGDSFGIG